MKRAYLTIDDSPGRDFAAKVAFLVQRQVPALLFCLGDKMEQRGDEVVEAIRQGFVIGNHSYSHPHFSDLSLEASRDEISRTDRIIDSLYRRAGVDRPAKYFRYPYFDVGHHNATLQGDLCGLGYRTPAFEGIGLKFFHNPTLLTDLDVKCTFDQQEYQLGNPEAPWGLSTAEAILARIDEDVPFEGRSLRCLETSDIILVHDHDETTDLFYRIIDRYLEVGIEFLPCPGPR